MTQRVQEQNCLAFLREVIMKTCPDSGRLASGIQGLNFYRNVCSGSLQPHFLTPLVFLVVQGAKAVQVGSENRRYGPGTCFLCGVDMPVLSCVLEASREEPYLALSLSLDIQLVAELTARMSGFPHDTKHFLGAGPQEVEPNLLDAFARLVDLTDHPASPLLELVLREIHCRLIESPFGATLRTLVTLGSQGNSITQAIAWLKKNYTKPLTVEHLARIAHMAPSTFHRYFKEITSISPLQYQKRLRLDEARRLMLTEGIDVTRASLAVGYESPTQFSREYKRLFGVSPKRSITGLKESVKDKTKKTVEEA